VALHCDAWEVVDVEGIEAKRTERRRVPLVGGAADSALYDRKAVHKAPYTYIDINLERDKNKKDMVTPLSS
jgi:hypothetical protein